MVAYFKNLFDYDSHSTLAMVDAMLSAGATGKPVDLMAHMLSAQQVWLLRCQLLPPSGKSIWPEGATIESMTEIIGQNHQDWIAYLDTLQDSNMQQAITYQNSRGQTFTNKLQDILAHLINHGTHHRAQIGQLLKFNGVEELPVSDYIYYLWKA